MSEETPSRCLDVNVVPTIADDPQRIALAKGVNDTLNAYITITDSKAIAFLGGSTAAASFFLSHRPDGLPLLICYALSAAGYAAGAIASLSVIYPRIPLHGNGVVFWGDIASRKSSKAYADDFDEACERGGLLHDYAHLNWCTSNILRRKVRRLRLAMGMCFAALAISVTVFIIDRQ